MSKLSGSEVGARAERGQVEPAPAGVASVAPSSAELAHVEPGLAEQTPGAQPSAEPDAEPAALAAHLQGQVVEEFSAYVHVPFCKVRCGYCDFNTYTNLDFGRGGSAREYPAAVASEIEAVSGVLDVRGLKTVFFGGGTPTMLAPQQLARIMGALTNAFGPALGEVTTEANPESVDQAAIEQLAAAGFNRISFGMQSAKEHVLKILDRQHTPGQVPAVVKWAREAGLRVSLDLIYGAPGESLDDWRASLEAALELDPGHISAYGLTVEPGTKMGAQVRRGELAAPDPDDLAAKYEIAAATLEAAGYHWYEVSNWAKPGMESRHNLAYWQGANWWGFGPGAHSHINGARAWNVKHPIAYAGKLAAGELAVAGSEILSTREREEEAIMLGVRLREGIATPPGTEPQVVAGLIADGLVDPAAALRGRIQLTLKGRLLADSVIRALW